jgi:hypothetical protein
MNAAPANLNAPSVTLPLRFVVAGLLSLITGVLWLVWRPDLLATYHYNQYVIAVNHLFVLGWITTLVMGAMYQLVPVALETRLYSERLARWQFVFHVAGFVGMVWMFWTWNLKQVGHFGSVFAVGVALFVYNLVRTLLRVPRWNVVATSVASALGWLALTVLAGLVIAAGKCSYENAALVAPSSPWAPLVRSLKAAAGFVARFDQLGAMHAHAHLGVVGIFLMLIVGISYKLVPMFTISEIQSPRRAVASVLLLNAGLAGSFCSILLRSTWKPLFAGVIIAGLGIFAWELWAILRARKRKTLDWGLVQFLTALGLLAPLAVLGTVLAWPTLALNTATGQLENLYGFLALLGVISFAILGMLYKILPFLIWFRAYSRKIGLVKVPSLADLYSPRLQKGGYWLFLAGLVVTSIAIILGHAGMVRAGCALLSASLSLFMANCYQMFSHLWRPADERSARFPAGDPTPAPATPKLRANPVVLVLVFVLANSAGPITRTSTGTIQHRASSIQHPASGIAAP